MSDGVREEKRARVRPDLYRHGSDDQVASRCDAVKRGGG